MSDNKPPSALSIERCISAWRRARAALEADDFLPDDEAVLALALASDPGALTPDELLRRMVGAIAFAEAREAEATLFAQAMRQRAARYSQRAMVFRTELLDMMLALERVIFTGSPFGTVSVAAGREALRVTDEAQIPDEYFRTRTERVLDRTKLLADLKQGVVVEGADTSNGPPVLRIIASKGEA